MPASAAAASFNAACRSTRPNEYLESHLNSLGGVVERGVTATKVDLTADDVSVELVHVDGRVEIRPTIDRHRGGRRSQCHSPFSERARWKD